MLQYSGSDIPSTHVQNGQLPRTVDHCGFDAAMVARVTGETRLVDHPILIRAARWPVGLRGPIASRDPPRHAGAAGRDTVTRWRRHLPARASELVRPSLVELAVIGRQASLPPRLVELGDGFLETPREAPATVSDTRLADDRWRADDRRAAEWCRCRHSRARRDGAVPSGVSACSLPLARRVLGESRLDSARVTGIAAGRLAAPSAQGAPARRRAVEPVRPVGVPLYQHRI